MAYAHAQGIIHRDVKPHNLLRDEQGTVKVTDLGLARLNHGTQGPAAGMDVTMAGGIIGTADYMSPEQAVDSTTIDHRSDIYSLGCTLHFLLTGTPPFSGPTLMSVLLKHRDGEIPSLSRLVSNCPGELDELFHRMLAKHADQRIQLMSEVVTELETIARNIGTDNSQRHNLAATMELPAGIELPRPNGHTVRLPDETISFQPNAASSTVLVVEPSRVQASIIKQYLQEHHVTVVGLVANGQEAIEAVRRLRPSVVVTAMHLKDVDGVTLAQQIRAEIKAGAPGFILITSESDEAGAGSLSQLNRVLVLTKPFSAAQLADSLKLVSGISAQFAPNQPHQPITGGQRRSLRATRADR